MPKVFFDISMSLDGFMTAANQTPDEPMGPGGHVVHDWAFAGDEQDRAVMTEGGATTGAVIAGRRTYDTSVPWWGADGPTGPKRLPVVVVSHGQPTDVPENGVYSFVDGIEPALAAAKQAAGDKDVTVMGGADRTVDPLLTMEGLCVTEDRLPASFSLHLRRFLCRLHTLLEAP